MHSNTTVWTKVTLRNITPLSDLGLHTEVAQIRIEKIGFHVVCAIHTVMQKTDLGHV